ncbi:MAG: glycerol-3-phosphate 1-O-acyltransferase PlsY [Ruminococcaceae bacterium]|nr:glycerol-3-phosphate 1-O-acyltransferase PlsY [Oscillospiraceae bacterium]
MKFSAFIAFGLHDLFKTGIIRHLLSGTASGGTAEAVIIGVGFALCILVSYLLGSINTALIVSKCFFHDDVREHGSGNAGTTNVLRTYGKKAAIITFVGDALKGVIAVLFACILFGHPLSEYNYLYLFTAAYLSAFFCIFGHVFPIFSRFRGGKGFATLAGVILSLNPFLFLVLFALYVPMVLLSHFISLSSVVAALFYPLMLSTVGSINTLHGPLGTDVLFAVMIGVLITWAHRGNLKRIYEGNERKFYLSRKKKEGAEPAKNEDPSKE